MQIVHISDSHISATDPQRAENMQACVDIINAADTSPDLVIHTGDITHNGSVEEYTTARAVLDQLHAPYCILVGNKDKRDALGLVFESGKHFFTHEGFIQYSLEQFPVRLIMLDTLSEHSNKGRLGKIRFDHLKHMLESDQTKPAYIFMHHSPFEVNAIPDPFQFEDWQEVHQLRQLLERFSNVVKIYCGHIHRSIEGELGGYAVSAISCMANDLRKGEMTDEQRTAPMLRFYAL